MQKVVVHKDLGNITYIKKLNNKSIRAAISVKKGIVVSMPYFVSYSVAEQFIENNKEKIAQSLHRQKQKMISGDIVQIRTETSAAQIEQLRLQAKKTIPALVKEISDKMNQAIVISNGVGETVINPFSYNSLSIRDNTSNWGSCSRQRNLNFNMHLVKLPKELMQFVIIHELAHLVYMNHGKDFHNMVNSACGGREKKYIKELKKYRLR